MKFIRATIHGFGKWTDTDFDFSNGSLLCFYGENETGKSTLQQFLLYMLFGLSPKKRKEYQPKNRTEIGGSLKIYDGNIGMLTLHRKEEVCKCLLEDGTIHDETWWKEQLSGLTRDIYTSIYAFSTMDLSHIQTMKQKELSDVLFSVGLTGSTAIYEVEKKLLTKLDNLYKKRGQNPLLNKQINTTASAYEQLCAEQEKEASYHSLVEKLQERKNSLMIEQKEAETLQKENITNEKIIQSLPDIHQLYNTQKELAEVPDVTSFPEDGVERLQNLHEAMLPLNSESAFLENKIKEYDEKLHTASEQLFTNDIIKEAQEIINEQANYEQRHYQLQEKRKQHKETSNQYQTLLYELEWDNDQTKGYSLPFHLEISWHELLESSKNHHLEKSNLDQEKLHREKKREQISDDMVHLYEQLLPNEQQEYMEDRLKQDKDTVRRKDSDLKWSQWREKKKRQSTFLLFGSAIAAIFMFIIAFLSEQNLLYIIPVIFVMAGLVQYVFSKQQLQAMAKMTGLNQEVSPLTENERQSVRQQLERQEENIAAIRHLKQEQKQLEFEDAQYTEALHMLMEKGKQIEEHTQNERASYPFLQGLEVAHWTELLKLIRQVQQVGRHLEELQKIIESLQVENNTVDGLLNAFSQGNTFKEVQACIDAQYSIEQFLQQYQKEKKELLDKKKMMVEQMEQLNRDKKQLFLIAEVESEEEFYEKANMVKRKEQLQQMIAKLSQRLQTVFPKNVIEYLLEKRPQTIEMETEIEINRNQFQEKQESIKECQQEIAQLQVEIDQLEGKEDASATAYYFQIEKDSLHEMQKQWSTLKLAYSALQKAKQAYQEKYMAEVLEWTTHLFSILTNGRYVHVFPPTETSLFQVEGIDDIRYTVLELSQGTIDQLYVSLRFAIAKVMNDTFCVPLLVDDAFVHFDDQRTLQATKILEEMAVEQQVLFFTCKKTTAEKLDVPKIQGKVLKEA